MITPEEYLSKNVLQFRNISEKITMLYKRKNADYGDSFTTSVRKYGVIAALTRISDKFNRLEHLMLRQDNQAQVKDETLQDTLQDLAAYSIMTIIALNDIKYNDNNNGRTDRADDTTNRVTDM